MRKNLPVTQTEYLLKDGMTIASRTDLKGRITYVNADFVAASGFEEAELIGQAHNLVRHPDMPEEAFADMWRTLQAGRPWTGLVKNRRKNGDHYWVMASATPVLENSSTSGYMSVLVFALYINSPQVLTLYTHASLLWVLGMIILYVISRLWLLASRGEVDDDPVLFSLKDRVSYAAAAAMGLILVLASL